MPCRIPPLLLLSTLLFSPSAYAFFSIDIFSIGPFSLSLNIPFAAGLFGLGIAAIFGGIFTTASGAGYTPPPLPIIEHRHSISVNIGEPRKKATLELMNGIREVINDDKIQLNGNAYLKLQDDGKMVFLNSSFNGYLMLHYDNSLTAWNPKNELLLVITRKDNALYVAQKQNCDCAELMNILFQTPHV